MSHKIVVNIDIDSILLNYAYPIIVKHTHILVCGCQIEQVILQRLCIIGHVGCHIDSNSIHHIICLSFCLHSRPSMQDVSGSRLGHAGPQHQEQSHTADSVSFSRGESCPQMDPAVTELSIQPRGQAKHQAAGAAARNQALSSADYLASGMQPAGRHHRDDSSGAGTSQMQRTRGSQYITDGRSSHRDGVHVGGAARS